MKDAFRLKFVVPGEPVPKGRPRSFRVMKNGKLAIRHVTPGKTVSYEKKVKSAAKRQMDVEKLEKTGEPVLVRIFVYMSTQKSWPMWKKDAAIFGHIAPTVKPDLSNIVKSVEDAMNDVVYFDDAQIVSLVVEKEYSSQARIYVEVEEQDRVPVSSATNEDSYLKRLTRKLRTMRWVKR